MITEINEPVSVSASFACGHLKPVAFFWQGRKYKVLKVLGSYHHSKGQFKRYFYAVKTDTQDIFEVYLDAEDMSWKLVRIHTEG